MSDFLAYCAYGAVGLVILAVTIAFVEETKRSKRK